MSLYARHILPRRIDFTCGLKPAMRQRAKLVPQARGCVLEMGVGSGLNLPFYDAARVTRLHALDPSPELWRLASERVAGAGIAVEYLEAAAEGVSLHESHRGHRHIEADCVGVEDKYWVVLHFGKSPAKKRQSF